MSAPPDVWSALANPVRRGLLDSLRDGPRTTGDLAATVPALSRYAVMQHLQVLEQAGLLLVRRQGRSRLNFVNPAPLEEVRQRWLHGFAEDAGRQLLALRRHVESDQATSVEPATAGSGRDQEEKAMETTTGVARAVRTESELRVAAPPARVFEALTVQQHRWYPYTYGGDRVRDIVFEPRVGGSSYEDWGDGAGHWYGTVMHYDPPVRVTIRGGLPGSTVVENSFELADDGEGGTVVRHSMTAFGELTDEQVNGINAHGGMKLFEPQLKAWVEDGVPVR